MSHDTVIQIAQLALAPRVLDATNPLRREEIAAKVDEILRMPSFSAGLDRQAIISQLEERLTVWSDDAQMLHGLDDHRPWLTARRSEIHWNFWNRYRLYMGSKIPPDPLEKLAKISDDVLGELEDPLRPGAWDRRGLVMGNVQSGKTANYTGLICKAADAGYKVIVVLAGMHNNLRSQTQIRLDEGFLGYKAVPPQPGKAKFERTGVGHLDSRPKADSVTNRSDKGDFNTAVASQFGIHPGGNPLLFVVKKYVSVLENLLSWIESCSPDGLDRETGRKYHRNIPLLVIDDEADQASVDTRSIAIDEDGNLDEEHNPTRINGLIRRLLISFDKSAYVGYTATPFANIFIHEKAKTRELGDDLFPRSFIFNLPTPSNYTGAGLVFGVKDEAGVGLVERDPLPIIRMVTDHAASDRKDETDGWMPPKLVDKTAHIPTVGGERRIPESLRLAILSFVLSIAVRSLRERPPFINSMLVHVVRYTNVQLHVKDQIEREVRSISNRLLNGDGTRTPTIQDELHHLWVTDFVPTSNACGAGLPEWGDVQRTLSAVAQTIEVKVINGSAKDALDYEEHRDAGLNIIAVGGDKLSRGLTLEGLTISYFLRSSRMYDTLMQMGRWFGYREKYLDVCRLFTTEELRSWFAHIASAIEELRMEFDYIYSVGGTPRDYGLKVRSHPALLVTSAVKMRSGTPMKLSYAGDISETIIFDRSARQILSNEEAAFGLVSSLGKPSSGSNVGGYLWTGVPVESVLAFLQKFRSHADAIRADTRLLSRYIAAQNLNDELVSWSVLVTSSSRTKKKWERFDDLKFGAVGLTEREPDVNARDRYSIRRLVNPADEWRDLTPEQLERAKATTVELWNASKRKSKSPTPPEQPSGRAVRMARNKAQGLLILYALDSTAADLPPNPPVIGVALSFPTSESAREIEYVVNNVFAEAGDYDSL